MAQKIYQTLYKPDGQPVDVHVASFLNQPVISETGKISYKQVKKLNLHGLDIVEKLKYKGYTEQAPNRLEDKTVAELRKLAQELGIPKVTDYVKTELIELIKEAQEE